MVTGSNLTSVAQQTRETQRKQQIRMEWGDGFFFFFPFCKEHFFLFIFQDPRNPRGWVPAGFPVDTKWPAWGIHYSHQRKEIGVAVEMLADLTVL